MFGENHSQSEIGSVNSDDDFGILTFLVFVFILF